MKKLILNLFLILLFSCGNDLYKIPEYNNIALDGAKAFPDSALLGEEVLLTVDAVVFNQRATLECEIVDESGVVVKKLINSENINKTITLSRRVNLEEPGNYIARWTLKNLEDKSIVKVKEVAFTVVREGAPIPRMDFVESIFSLLIGGTLQIDTSSSVNGASVSDASITKVDWAIQYLEGDEWKTATAEDGLYNIDFPQAAFNTNLNSYFAVTLPRTVGTYRFSMTLTNSYNLTSTGYSQSFALGYQPLPPSDSVIFFDFEGMSGPYNNLRSIASETMTQYGQTLFSIESQENYSLIEGLSQSSIDGFEGLLMPFSFTVSSIESSLEQTLFAVSGNNSDYFTIFQKGKTVGMRYFTNGSDGFNVSQTMDIAIGDEVRLVFSYDKANATYRLFGGSGILEEKSSNGKLFFETISSINLGSINYGDSPLCPADNSLIFGELKMYNVVYGDEIQSWARSYTEQSSVDQSPLFPEKGYIADFLMVQSGDETKSNFFRIPCLLALRNPDGSLTNTVLALQDVRYSGNADSPANIDIGLRISTDGGKSFGRHSLIPSLTVDDRPRKSGTAGDSASFIDACVFQNWETGRVFAIPDAFPWGAGLMGGNVGVGTPFKTINGEQVMMLTATAAVLNNSAPKDGNTVWETEATNSDVTSIGSYYVKNVDKYPEYVTDENGTILYDEDGYAQLKKPFKREIFDNRNVKTNYFLNERFEVCYDDGTDRGIVLKVKQIGGTEVIPMNIMYKRSIFQMFRTSYNYVVYSDDEGKTWSDPINISGQINKPEQHVSYLIVGPGNALYVDDGPYKGRVVVSMYANKSEDGQLNNEIACAVWSDDNGMTWKRGAFPNTFGNTGKLSESVPVKMPSGNIRLFCRTASRCVGTMLSTDGGATFGTPKKIDQIYNGAGNGCQITCINYPEKIDGYPAIVLASPQNQSGRQNGTIWIGLIKDQDGEDIEWRYNKLIHPGSYSYSCMTAIPTYSSENRPAIGLYAELESLKMSYIVFPIEDIMQK